MSNGPRGHLRGEYETTGLDKAIPEQVQQAFPEYFQTIALYPIDRTHRKAGRDKDFRFEGKDYCQRTFEMIFTSFQWNYY